jgi:CHAT domain-containing protein
VNPALEVEHHQALPAAENQRAPLIDAFRRWGGGEVAWEIPLTGRQFLGEARKSDNIFLYSHGRFMPNDPMGSYLRFADQNGKASNVSAAELLATKTGRGLWVLAACSSGVGKVRSGDEVLGLPRALLEAGASMVVISLWEIDASSSLDLMVRFYQHMASGSSVAQALHSASAELRQAGQPPYDWAPFILIGHHGFDKR